MDQASWRVYRAVVPWTVRHPVDAATRAVRHVRSVCGFWAFVVTHPVDTARRGARRGVDTVTGAVCEVQEVVGTCASAVTHPLDTAKEVVGRGLTAVTNRSGYSRRHLDSLGRTIKNKELNSQRKHDLRAAVLEADQPVTRVCSELSSLLYEAEDQQSFDRLVTKYCCDRPLRTAYVHPDPTKPAMGFFIMDGHDGIKTMYMGFRGSHSPFDWLTDLNATPVKTNLWHDRWPDLEAHSGMIGIIDHARLTYENLLLREIKDHNVAKIVFTGHSLGEGLAQLALVATQAHAQFQGLKAKVDLQAVLFSSPMVLALEHAKREHSPYRELLGELRQRFRHYLHKDDIVPRLPGHTDWWKRHAVAFGQSMQMLDSFEYVDVAKK